MQSPAALAYLASAKRFTLASHLALLDDYLCQLARGDIKRLMVFMPPRHGKSLLCSQYFPAWYIGRYKGRVILTSYEASFAASWGRLARNVLTEWGPPIFGVHVAQDSSAADHWELEGAEGQRGVMFTAGVGGAITGKGASLLIIDDPVKNMDEASSVTYRDKAWQWYTSTAYTRLEPNGRVLVIQTRWHEDDLSGRILSQSADAGDGEPWTVVSLPAIAERAEEYHIAGDAPFVRAEGDPLWPERFPRERLAAIRADVGGLVWSALYQQHPTPPEGGTFKREWFTRRYRELPQLTTVIQTVDSAFKEGTASDYSVIATWGTDGRDYYVINIWRKRVAFPELVAAIRDQAALFHPSAIIVEDRASGQSAIQVLKRETNLPIIAVQPNGSKENRADAASPVFEAGKVLLPENAPWVAEWIEEHVNFPRASHDDQVDTSSYAIARLRSGSARIAFAVARPELMDPAARQIAAAQQAALPPDEREMSDDELAAYVHPDDREDERRREQQARLANVLQTLSRLGGGNFDDFAR